MPCAAPTPGLTPALALFARLTAGEELPGREQLRPPALSRFWAVVLLAAAAAAALITPCYRRLRPCDLLRRSLRRRGRPSGGDPVFQGDRWQRLAHQA